MLGFAEGKLEKMKIVAYDKKDYTSKAGEYEVLLNPETYSETYKISYVKPEGGGTKGGDLKFDKVLLMDDGKSTQIGEPYLKGKTVEAVLEEEGRAKKVTVIRFKSKSRYFRKKGHRQPFAKIKIAG